ncbi:MAG: methyl-accepting chemotaxis protein [Pseudomonadota bacterium]
MSEDFDIYSDPLVVIQEALFPALRVTSGAILALATGRSFDKGPVTEALNEAETMLRTGIAQNFDPVGLTLSENDQARCKAAADIASEMQQCIEDGERTPDGIARIEGMMRDRFEPAINEVVNICRTTFIGAIYSHQDKLSQQTEEALGALDQISRQINFIAINASIEAARVGDAGRGFTVISSEIRSLAQQAETTTQRLGEILDRKSHWS